jgi:hypothetical protein
MHIRVTKQGRELYCGPISVWYREHHLDPHVLELALRAIANDGMEVHTGIGSPEQLTMVFWMLTCSGGRSPHCALCRECDKERL